MRNAIDSKVMYEVVFCENEPSVITQEPARNKVPYRIEKSKSNRSAIFNLE